MYGGSGSYYVVQQSENGTMSGPGPSTGLYGPSAGNPVEALPHPLGSVTPSSTLGFLGVQGKRNKGPMRATASHYFLPEDASVRKLGSRDTRFVRPRV